MILQNSKIKSFFLNKNLEIFPLILLLSLLLTTLHNNVHAAGVDAYQNGNGATATGDESVAIGFNAQANSDYAISIGSHAGNPYTNSVAGQSSINIGLNTHGGGAYSIAIGPRSNRSDVSATGDYAVALGTGAQANATAATAFGTDSLADHEGSVAIGTSARPTHTYTVTVGSGYEEQPYVNRRRITHVDDPIEAHDVATKAYADTNRPDLSGNINQIKKRIKSVGAMQMSIMNAQVDLSDSNRTAVGIGVGSYQGAKATTVGLVHRMPGRFSGFQLSGNLTIGNEGDKAGGGGIGYVF